MNARPSIPAQGCGQPLLDIAIVQAALPVPAVVLNAEDRFTFVNGAAEQFFKLSESATCHTRVSDLLPRVNRVVFVL